MSEHTRTRIEEAQQAARSLRQIERQIAEKKDELKALRIDRDAMLGDLLGIVEDADQLKLGD